ncbi:unnamed protein product, partial [marine sediment metagenome]
DAINAFEPFFEIHFKEIAFMKLIIPCFPCPGVWEEINTYNRVPFLGKQFNGPVALATEVEKPAGLSWEVFFSP